MLFKKKENSVHTLIMEQINDVENCFIQFEGFMRSVCVPETAFETLKSLAEGIGDAEAVADKSLRRMIDSLMEGTYLPSTKEDLISIATSCDRVANKCEAFANSVVFQNFRIPTEYDEDLMEILEITHTQFELLEKSISKLFAEFGDLIKDHSILDDIRVQESKVDAIEESLYQRIFALDIELANKMQIASFIGLVCDISDIIENIADKIQIMLVSRKA